MEKTKKEVQCGILNIRIKHDRIVGYIKIWVSTTRLLLQFVGETLSKRVKVIYPDSIFKIMWDILVVVLIILNIFYIPMKISFEIDKKDNKFSSFLLETLPSYVFILEIILNFNTAYYSKGIIHTSRKQIFKHYVGGSFVWDLIVVVPFIISQF